jgi:hypothetical protein
MNDEFLVTFTEAMCWRLFGGFFPRGVSNRLLAFAVLQASPPFADADAKVKDYFLVRMSTMIEHRRCMQFDAQTADSNAEWKS